MMLNSKQRAWLRARANPLESQFQIGKGEISESLCKDLDDMLSTHELLKVTVLKSASEDVSELARALAESVDAELVQVIGRRFVLYRASEKLERQGKSILLPR